MGRSKKNKERNKVKQVVEMLFIITLLIISYFYGNDILKITAYGNVVDSNSLPISQLYTYTNIDDIPKYSDNIYVTLNNNIPYFDESEYTTKSFETYSELDSLGRCGPAYANICMEIMPTEKREDINSVIPTGWVQAKYNGSYLYNRCHLIGFQLAGENDNKLNLITGTSYFNVTGMLPFEDEVDDYIEQNKNNHVLYRVTPIYEGNNLVASGVEIEAYSVEDNGRGVCFNVFVYNVQPGIHINYATGESWEE